MKDSLPELPEDIPEQVAALRTALLALINNSFETNAKVDKLSERINDLQILQRQTDERLNAVILMVEKFLGSQNGNSEKQ